MKQKLSKKAQCLMHQGFKACIRKHVYARHLLINRRQVADETTTDYLQVLKNLSKDYTFTAVLV